MTTESKPDSQEGDDLPERLPPPVFPPGSARHGGRWSGIRRRSPESRPSGAPADERSGEVPRSAVGSPGEPSLSKHDDLSLILPDEPLPERRAAPRPEEITVTGIGNDPHLDELEPAPRVRLDADLKRLTEMVEALAHHLKERGEAGLRTSPGMTRFEATMRAYCVGWLAARREEGG